jgi:predicted Zn-dependent protease
MPKAPPSVQARPGPHSAAIEAAEQALRIGRPDEAERLARQVLKSERVNVLAGRLLGTALLMQDRPAEAVEPLQRAARRSGDPAIETLLARALAGAARTEAALTQLRQATSRRPPLPQAFLELGDQLAALARFEVAAAAYEAGLALAPEAQVLRVGLAYLRLRLGDRARARALFEAVRAAAPDRRDAQVGLAAVLAQDGAWAEAAELYRAALEARPDDAATRIELARSLLEMGQREAGEAALRIAAGADPRLTGQAALALAATPRGRLFLHPSAAARFLGVRSA